MCSLSQSDSFPRLDSDTTPVFFESKQLFVSGVKIAAGSSVHPVSAVTTVELLSRSLSYLGTVLKFAGFTVFTVVLALLSWRFAGGLVGPVGLLPVAMTLVAICAVLLTSVGAVTYLMERTLRVWLSSGNCLTVSTLDTEVALQMHSAIKKAITYSANRSSGIPSVADELGRLSELRSQGAISEEDWERSKDLFLGKRPDAREQLIIQIRQLHELHKGGVLSESEFNMKKWDILSRSAL
jgi:hypothetical protein